MPGEGLQHLGVDVRLRLDARFGVGVKEAQLGTEQADPLDRRLACRPGRGAVGDVGQNRHRMAVGCRPGPGPAGHRRSGDMRRRHRGSSFGTVRGEFDGSAAAVEQHQGSDIHRVEAFHRHHARDTELAGDDRGVAGRAAQGGGQPDDPVRVQAGGVGRGEILGEQNRRFGRFRHSGRRQSGEFSDDPIPDVLEVGDPFGHQPAHFGEHLNELCGCIVGRSHGRLAGLDRVLRRSPPGPVLGQLGSRGKHLRRRSGGRCRAVPQPLGHGGHGLVEPRRLGGPIGVGDVAAGIQITDVGKAVGPDDRRETDARDDRDTLQNGGFGGAHGMD